jgi:phosphoribosylglycinamide formyltransferase-1
MSQEAMPVVVLISGSGTNLQALIDGEKDGSLPIRIRAVISNKAGVKGLERAKAHGIPARVLSHKDYASREEFDAQLRQLIDSFEPKLVVLAGFMRILTAGFTQHYAGHMLNIHPSLLPKYQGLHTHRRALEAGDTVHGVTVHFVTDELDGGPAIIQAQVPVLPGDDEQVLTQRVLEQEHVIYPRAVHWFAEARLELKDGKAWLDGQPLPASGVVVTAPGEGR